MCAAAAGNAGAILEYCTTRTPLAPSSRLASTQASSAARAQGRAPSLVAEDGYFAQNERHFRVVPVHDGAIPTARS